MKLLDKLNNDAYNHMLFCSIMRVVTLSIEKAKSDASKQRWSRGHKARGQGQGHKKNPRPRPRTAFPRTDTLEAKDSVKAKNMFLFGNVLFI